MALLFMDSFDHYVTADLAEKWTTTGVIAGSTITIGSGNGRRASNGLRQGRTSGSGPVAYVLKTLAPGDATCVMGFALVVPGSTIGTVGMPLAYVRDGGTAQVTLRVNADYTLTVCRGAHNGTILATSVGAPLSAGVMAYLEWKVLVHASAGTVEVHVNGAAVAGLTLTGQNTRNTATAQWTSVALGIFDAVSSTTTGTNNVDYDDFYVCDGSGAAPWNTFLGDCRVDARYPTAAGATTGWTPSTGANWQCVDETAPNDDTDYTAAAAAGLTDTFVVQDAPVVGGAIYGIQHCLSAKKTDAGAASIAPVVRHSGTDNVGASLNPGTTYAVLQQIAATNPGTAAAWTESGFNSAEFGYKRTV